MQIQDDRTEKQKETHPWLIVATDTFLSGWGLAEGGKSYAAWACKPEDREKCFDIVSYRSEMKRVRTIFGKYRPRGIGHLHIYVFKG